MTNSRRRTLPALVLIFVALLAASLMAQDKASSPKETPKSTGTAKTNEAPILPASLSGFADSGVFHLYKDEERLITIDFSWKPDGTFENRSVMSLGGQSATTKVKITPDKDGRWQIITLQSPAATTTVVREATVARRTTKRETATFKLRPGMTLFENFSPALLSQTVRAYDQKKAGKQTIPVFIVPRAAMSATLERKDAVDRSVNGKDFKLTRYTYTLFGIDLNLWMDDRTRVLMAEVPSQHVAYVRDGFEILQQAQEKDPLISKPTSAIRNETVDVPMRDGVRLSTNIYRPTAEGKYPAILVRTPYKKEMSELQGRFYARRGYVVAIQDCRGRFGSPGTWEPFINEPHDGYDTVEWLAAQPWSSGNVGMIGGSYLGWVQWWAAQRPSHLVTIIPNVAPPDPFYNLPYEHGVFFLWAAIWWADVLESQATADLSGAAMTTIGEKRYKMLLNSLPVIDLDKKVLGKENRYWRQWIAHPVNDSYWEQANFLDRLADVNIPAFHQSGWFDGDGIGSKLNYARMQRHHAPDQKLVLGPWGHTDQAMRRFGDRDFGPEAVIDLPRDYLRWFDHYLKRIENGINKEPLVNIFVMGSNHWLRGNVYPLPETRFDKWYLTSGGKANTSKGDGLLTRNAPANEQPDRYTYDPGDPTPDPTFFEEPEEKKDQKGARPQSDEEKKRRSEAYHEQITAARPDILVYVTEPLKEPYTFAGPVSAVLYASSSAVDTDWFVRLMEVDEKGKLFDLVEGKVRARFRESTKTPQLLEPGKIYEYQIDLWQTGITIPKGRRLRVEIASASFPFFSRNLNTGGHNETETRYVPAEETIYHSRQYPSHVLLPAIPQEHGKKP